ncbi:winged helix-turn-helix domain-containing protein [Pannonibacter sp. Pt2-lr]
MTIPDYQTLMLPVLRLAAEGETRVGDAAGRIAGEFGLTPQEQEEMLPSGRQRVLHNRIHWAKFYMSKAGLIVSPGRGRFVASDKGRALLAGAPQQITLAMLMQEPEFRAFYESGAAAPAGKTRRARRGRLLLRLPLRRPHRKSRSTRPMRP